MSSVFARTSRDIPGLVEAARTGDARAVARLVSLVEDADPCLPTLAAALAGPLSLIHI